MIGPPPSLGKSSYFPGKGSINYGKQHARGSCSQLHAKLLHMNCKIHMYIQESPYTRLVKSVNRGMQRG